VKKLAKKATNQKTKSYLSTDLDAEYFDLLNSIIKEKNLNSRREGLAVVFEGYKKSLNPSAITVDPTICEYLSDDKTLCCKNKDKFKKTTVSECNACQKAQKTLAKNQRLEEIQLHGNLLRHELTERMWIFELGVPFEKTGYDTFNRLVFLKEKLDQKDRELENLPALENDNAFLRQQLSEKVKEIEKLTKNQQGKK
jgi:hypothetical protein